MQTVIFAGVLFLGAMGVAAADCPQGYDPQCTARQNSKTPKWGDTKPVDSMPEVKRHFCDGFTHAECNAKFPDGWYNPTDRGP
jgi:hypothetical protein